MAFRSGSGSRQSDSAAAAGAWQLLVYRPTGSGHEPPVRRSVDARLHAPLRHTEAVLAPYDPDASSTTSPGARSATSSATPSYHGHEGIRKWTRDRYDAWEAIEDECQELIDAGDKVISFVISRGRGRSSGVEAELRHYGVWTMREGKIARVAWYYSREDAHRAAGLEE